MENVYYIFDVDGTICYPRRKMDEEFSEYFYGFCCRNNVVVVSGSTVKMIQEQIPEFIFNKIKVYGCSGVEGISFDIPEDIEDDELFETLNLLLLKTNFFPLSGNHIQKRKGMINFSICGRNADLELRSKFEDYDKKYGERAYFLKELNKKFGHKYEFSIGGSTSIDISRSGINKSLVAKDLQVLYDDPKMIFFGDGIINNGNDFPLAKYIHENNLGYSININYSEMKKDYKRLLL